MDGVALVYLAAVIALASVTYRYIEVLGYDAAKRFVNRRSHAVTGNGAASGIPRLGDGIAACLKNKREELPPRAFLLLADTACRT